jgi:thymidylate synthase (FAD)
MEETRRFTGRPTNPSAEEILGLYFPVLDHGFVSLVDYMGGDDDVDRAARVSYGHQGVARKSSEVRNLLRFLRRHKHTTPSEMVELKFHCCMPIFIARQWIRHRTANVNEQSGRYSLLPMLFYTPEREQFRPQSTTNKQGRAGEQLDELVYSQAVEGWQRGRETKAAQYEWLASHDVAKELARIDLPLSTYTQWYWKIDLHNLMHFLGLRVDSHAQWEIQQYGKVMAGMMKRVAPLSYEAWIDYDVDGARFSRMEMEVLLSLVGADKEGGVYVQGYDTATFKRKHIVEEFGLSEREVDEFVEKLTSCATPDFELDLSKAKPASYFEEKMAEAAPKPPQA